MKKALENRSKQLLLALVLLLPAVALAQGYVFGPNVRVNDDPPGANGHNLRSSGQRLIAARGDTVYMCWDDDRTGYFHVYFARSTNGGLTFSPNIRIDQNIEVEYEALAVDGRGGIHICWNNRRWTSTGRYIYYSKSTDAGMTFSMPLRVVDSAVRANGSPAIAVSRDGQRIYIVHDTGSTGHYDLFLACSRDGGRTFVLPEAKVNDDTGMTTPIWYPTLTIFKDTVVLVAWNGLYVAKSTDGGGSFSPSVQVASSNGFGNAISTDSAGRVYVVWRGPEIATSDNLGDTFSIPRHIGPDIGQRPSLWVSAAGRVYITYDFDAGLSDGGYYEVRFAFSPDRGTTFLPPVNPSDGPINTEEWFASVAASEGGAVYVCWHDNRNDLSGIRNDVYFASGAISAIADRAVSAGRCPDWSVSASLVRKMVEIRMATRRAGQVRLAVFDLTGRLVTSLMDATLQRGEHSAIWDCTNRAGSKVSPGVYFIRLETSEGSSCRKIQVVAD
jgi:hypothetical protein